MEYHCEVLEQLLREELRSNGQRWTKAYQSLSDSQREELLGKLMARRLIQQGRDRLAQLREEPEEPDYDWQGPGTLQSGTGDSIRIAYEEAAMLSASVSHAAPVTRRAVSARVGKNAGESEIRTAMRIAYRTIEQSRIHRGVTKAVASPVVYEQGDDLKILIVECVLEQTGVTPSDCTCVVCKARRRQNAPANGSPVTIAVGEDVIGTGTFLGIDENTRSA